MNISSSVRDDKLKSPSSRPPSFSHENNELKKRNFIVHLSYTDGGDAEVLREVLLDVDVDGLALTDGAGPLAGTGVVAGEASELDLKDEVEVGHRSC